MVVIPAIDLRGGRCVRLVEGRLETETVYGDDPLAWARRFVAAGARRLHVVDLDGAFAGRPRQAALVAELARAVPVPVQVGGGLRDPDAVAAVLGAGARWAILGTRAALDPGFLAEACRRWPGRILVGVDAAEGRVAVEGWTRCVDLTAGDLARASARAGAAGLVYTDTRRDGTGRGPDVAGAGAVAAAGGLPVFVSGGIGAVADLRRLAAIPGVAGAIVGRALYTGAIDLPAALAAVPA